MNLIAMAVLAPTLGYFVTSRRIVVGGLVAVWSAILPAQTHWVLLVDQLETRSYSNTIGYFAINYAFLAAGIGAALAIRHRRERQGALPEQSTTAFVAG